MVVIAIIGILAAVAVPQYGTYTKRAKYAEVISLTKAVKLSVEECIQQLNTPDDCDGGENGVEEDFTSAGITQKIETVAGAITATGSSIVDQKTYILQPTYTPSTNSLTWEIRGTCKATGYC